MYTCDDLQTQLYLFKQLRQTGIGVMQPKLVVLRFSDTEQLTPDTLWFPGDLLQRFVIYPRTKSHVFDKTILLKCKITAKAAY